MAPGCGRPSNQALDALLAGYASGSLEGALHALVAGHLALDPRSRVFVRNLEAANGVALEGIEPKPVTNREAKLERIFADESAARVGSDPPPDRVLPPPLARFFSTNLDGIRWRTLWPGVKAFKVAASGRGEAVLYWIRPGREVPAHAHEGSEYTLVLKGGFTDGSGHYRRGDIAIADQDTDHRPRIDEDEDCICYTVTDAPLRLTGPVGRLLYWLGPK